MITYDFSDMIRDRNKYYEMHTGFYVGMRNFNVDAETFCGQFKDVLFGIGRSQCIYAIKRYASFINHFKAYHEGNEFFLKSICESAKTHKRLDLLISVTSIFIQNNCPQSR